MRDVAADQRSNLDIVFFYFPGAFIPGESFDKMIALNSGLYSELDFDQIVVSYDYLNGWFENIDYVFEKYIQQEVSKFTRLVFIGESVGLTLACSLRKKYQLDALVIGSSPDPSHVYAQHSQRQRSHQISAAYYEPVFVGNPAATRHTAIKFGRSWFGFYGGSDAPISDLAWDEEDNAILFTGNRFVCKDYLKPQSFLSENDIEHLFSAPKISVINLDGQGHRVLMKAFDFVCAYCRPYILDPLSRPTEKLRLNQSIGV